MLFVDVLVLSLRWVAFRSDRVCETWSVVVPWGCSPGQCCVSTPCTGLVLNEQILNEAIINVSNNQMQVLIDDRLISWGLMLVPNIQGKKKRETPNGTQNAEVI